MPPDEESDSKLVESIENFLETGKDWEKIATPIESLTVQKIPKTRTREARVMVHINPVMYGKKIKRNGLLIGQADILDAFIRVLGLEETKDLVYVVEQVNKKVAAKKKSGKMLEW